MTKKTLRLAGMVLGIAGGVLAPAGMAFIIEVWGHRDLASFLVLEFFVGALPTAVLGITGGALSPGRPRLGAALMLLAGVWGAGWGWVALTVFGWPLLLAGAVLAFLGRERTRPAAAESSSGTASGPASG
jgi:hypothetical protein